MNPVSRKARVWASLLQGGAAPPGDGGGVSGQQRHRAEELRKLFTMEMDDAGWGSLESHRAADPEAPGVANLSSAISPDEMSRKAARRRARCRPSCIPITKQKVCGICGRRVRDMEDALS